MSCADALAKALAESEGEMTKAVMENERMEEWKIYYMMQ